MWKKAVIIHFMVLDIFLDGVEKNNEIISGYPIVSVPTEIQTGQLSNQIEVRNITTQANLLSTYMAKSFSYRHMDSHVI
jgi:hypothetical protein